MGLDITAGSKIVFIEAFDEYEVFEDKYYTYEPGKVCPYVCLSPERSFLGRDEPIDFHDKDYACYRVDGELMGFRAGSYSGYNDWRERLCQMVNHYSPQSLWEHRDDPAVQALPFYPLIDFSDCEGVIGSVAAARLAADFEAYQTRADRHTDEWFREKYQLWRRACELAADDGFIDFH